MTFDDQNHSAFEKAGSVETSEGKRARYHRGQVYSLLEELVLAMEDARSEGFVVQFTIPTDQEGRNVVAPENLSILKKW